ncbi:MAG: TatD family hydrolase [Bacteroidetes bacterium]|nr:TatD family hydrolase [Bacteroidota bacterium]
MFLFDCHTHGTKNLSHSIFNAELNNNPIGWFSAGQHPWNTFIRVDEKKIHQLLSHPKCLAIGEIGLDRLKGANLEIQIQQFVQQLKINQEFKLPVLIHEVKTLEEIIQIKRDFPSQSWILHGFQKNKNLEKVLFHDFYLSIGASILKKKELFQSIAQIPIERLLIESDMDEHLLFEIYSTVARSRNVELLTLLEQIEKNFKRIFSKWQIG